MAQSLTANKGAASNSQTPYGCGAEVPVNLRTAGRIERLTSSPVREILSVANRSDIVSFAGGLPDHASFPALAMDDIDAGVLQYGASEGEDELRQWIAEDLRRRNLPVTASQILILSGSQQGIDLVAKMFIERQSLVAVESPTYLAALQVFSLFGASYLSFRPGSYQPLVSAEPVMTYCIPTFQNPTGYCYTQPQRMQLASICQANGSVLFEDDPYRDLVYGDCDRQPVCSYMEQGNWIYQSSFSKTLAPGLRLGYLACSPSLYPVLGRLKQAADLHSNRLSQQLVLSLLTRSDYQQRLTRVKAAYREKRDHFDSLLRQYFSNLAEWSRPDGGLFFWLKLTTRIDTRNLLSQAIAHGVAFMPGEPFFPEADTGDSYIRLNFSHASASDSAAGLEILAELIEAESVGNN